MIRNPSPKAISLFSGAGGMDIGFSKAGFKILAAVEIDPSCCETLRHNLHDTQIINGDLSSLSGSELLDMVGMQRGELDMLFGGPPCQSFSLAGNRKGLDDPRGELVGHFSRLVHELAPRTFVMENVKGMTNWAGGQALRMVLDKLAEPVEINGEQQRYHCAHKVLNAVDFGVPQYRERLFIVGNRMGKKFNFPNPSHFPASGGKAGFDQYSSVGEAISSLPPAAPPSTTALRVSQTIKGRIERHGY